MTQKWNWIPNKGLGSITLGSDIESLVQKYGAVYGKDCEDDSERDSYYLPSHDLYVDVCDDRIISITAYREFLYGKQNVIGMRVERLNRLLGCLPDEVGDPVDYEDGDVKNSYDYFDLGLQVWASDGIVSSATCLSYSEEKDE